jgi:internalin A
MTESELLALIEQAEREQWEELDLSGQGMTELPPALRQLRQLKRLKLGYDRKKHRRNYLTALPDWLGQLTNLQSLDLSRNKLADLPEWLGQLTNLQSLNLGHNNFTALPGWMGQLTNLQSLDLSGNHLKLSPDWLTKFISRQSFSVLQKLTNLQSLSLNNANLTRVPEELSQLTNLQSLDLSSNKLTTLPAWLGRLHNLQSLNLSYNDLTNSLEAFSRLTNLQSLYLGGNNLTDLPEGLSQLINLQSLGLSDNNFADLPEGLSELINLQSLDLSDNNFTDLPEGLSELINLQSLDLSSNKLTSLPEGVVRLPYLRYLYLFDNPITEPSAEMLGETLNGYRSADIEALCRYYDQLRQAGAATFYEAKLLIIGEAGAGKTSLAHKIQSPTTALNPQQESTEGIDIVTWDFALPEGYAQEQYRVNIWDFGGQMVYLATHQFFLTKRSVYVLVADTRREHTNFYTWLLMQETFGADSPVLLLKNRNRRHGNSFTIENLPQLRERFPNLKEVIELDLNSVPQEESWPQLLRSLHYHFLSLEHVGKPRPRTWVQVREALKSDERDTMTRQQFLELCQQQGIQREEDALQLSDYLHHLGDILHFQNDDILGDIVILKPTWGLDAVYRVLDNKEIIQNLGRFTLGNLRSLWHETRYDDHHHHLLRLMQNFQLCYPLPEKQDQYIAPQLISDEVPPYGWDNRENLLLRYQYPVFMPRGILSRAIVKLHERIEKQALVWRSGVILNDGFARAELLELHGEREIRIRVAGRNKRDLFMEIVRALEALHLSFPKTLYQKLIPCKCATCTPLTEPHFFVLDKLLERLANRKETIECENPPYETVFIRGLVDDLVLSSERGAMDRDTIYNIAGDYIASGAKFMDTGDHIAIDAIENSTGVAIGASSQASVHQNPPLRRQRKRKFSAKP